MHAIRLARIAHPVQSARLLLERFPDRAAGQLPRLEELAASAMREIQALPSQLRPRSVGEEGLPLALRRLAAERLGRDGLDVTVELSSLPGADTPFPSDASGTGRPSATKTRALSEAEATGLYRMAQEALTNVAKHAATQRAIVHLNLAGGASFLEIEDDGIDFDSHQASSERGHLGLAGIAERAQELGWHLSIESHPGHGTRIRVSEKWAGGVP